MSGGIILFEDKDVMLSEKQLVIKFYHFPICTSKHIPIQSIRKVEVKDLGWGKGRLWGMSISHWGYWLAGDSQRFNRQKFIGVDIGSWVKPSFTSQKIQLVYKILSELVEKNQEKLKQMQSTQQLKNK